MAKIEPFCAWRYAPPLEAELDRLLTPPYDVISPALQEALYARHPKNFCRIDFAREEPGDREGHDKYGRAAATWESWRREGTFRRDERPAFYVYEQEFALAGKPRRRRRGFFCAVALESLRQGEIRGHERTLEGPKADRLRLTRATQCNLSPIFALYEDVERLIDGRLHEATTGAPLMATTIDDVTHRLWTLTEASALADVIQAIRQRRLFIADGHHRYETALAYQEERRREQGGVASPQPFDSTLMFLCNAHGEGVEILPTHRLLPADGWPRLKAGGLESGLTDAFDVTELDGVREEGEAGLLATALEQAGRSGPAFIALTSDGSARLLRLRPSAEPDRLIPGRDLPPEVKRLDVTLLHEFILKRLAAERPQGESAPVDYVHEIAEAIGAVRSGRATGAFLLNPTPTAQVIEIANLGARMPPKSTYFYPKIITGLVVRDLRPSD